MISFKFGKNFSFLVFFLAFTLTMCGAASATTTNTTHNNLSTSVNESTNYNSPQNLPDPQVYRNGESVGSYNSIAQAISAAKSGDTIMLADGATFDEHSLTINKNLDFNVINNGKATINAQGKGSVFIINDYDVTAELQNLILENSKANGAAIINAGTLNVKDCTFQDNAATTVNNCGGAIINDYILTVTDSTFTDNSVTYGDGGAIGNFGSCNVTSSTFTGNTAQDGGAFYNLDGIAIYSNCNFTDNKATSDGGAIGNMISTITLSNCNFTGNKATSDGGAIYNYGAVTVNNSNFKDNTANDGGAIYNEYGNLNEVDDLNVNKSTFTSNSATNAGGAIENDHNGTCTVTSSTFTDNIANANNNFSGGAIYNHGTVTITGCNFVSNTAINNVGGAVYNYEGTVTVKSSTFKGNTALQGGAIYNDGTVTINGSTFTSNTAYLDGGAIENEGNLTVKDSNLTDNTAPNNLGGAIYNDVTATLLFNRIVGNTAVTGSAIYNAMGTVNAKYNWWGCNTQASVAKLISNNYGGSVTYSPWIVLTITAEPTNVLVGGTSTITADLLHDNNGVYENPTNGVVPYTGSAGFTTTEGTIKNSDFSNGKATSTLTTLNTAEQSTISSTVDGKTVSTNVMVTGVSISQLISESSSVKAFYETHNDVLPSSVTISGQTITMPQLLQLLVTGTININKGNLNSLPVLIVNPASNSSGSFISGNINKSEYLSIAQTIKDYITSNGKAPNNTASSLGTITFSKLVYSYSKIINYYGEKKELPNYVSLAT